MSPNSLKKNEQTFHKSQQILGARPGDYELGSLESRAAARSTVIAIDRDHGALTMTFGNLPTPEEFLELESVEGKAITLGNLPVSKELTRG